MKIKLLLLVLLTNCFLNAQDTNSVNFRTQSAGRISIYNSGGAWVPGVYEDKTIRGSVYLNENWEGLHQIRTKSGEAMTIASLNYNLHKNTLESKVSKDSVFQIDAKGIDFIKIGNKKYKFFEIGGKQTLSNVLYQSPKITLIKIVELSVSQEIVNPATKQVISEAAYEKKEKYLIRKNEENFVDFNLKKKKFMNFFGQNSEKLAELSKSKKINFESEKDVFSIFEFYDTL